MWLRPRIIYYKLDGQQIYQVNSNIRNALCYLLMRLDILRSALVDSL